MKIRLVEETRNIKADFIEKVRAGYLDPDDVIYKLVNYLPEKQIKSFIDFYSNSLNSSELDITDIFLLSVEEYEKYEDLIPNRADDEWWWLRSPGSDSNRAALISNDGSIYDHGDRVDVSENVVRPALRISNLSSFNVKPGDIVYIFNIKWIVLDKNLVIAKKDIGEHRFDKESNNYEKSEIRKYLYRWLDEQKEKYIN